VKTVNPRGNLPHAPTVTKDAAAALDVASPSPSSHGHIAQVEQGQQFVSLVPARD
jgi:hypothetical protein